MEILVTDQTAELGEQHQDEIARIIQYMADHLTLPENTEVSIILVDNETIHQINKKSRGKDYPTDVISFALDDDDTDEDIFGQLSDELPLLLGDIYISIDKAKEQAEEYQHSFETELAFLVVHGFLHLNGYDHQEPKEAEEMFGLQNQLLEELGYDT